MSYSRACEIAMLHFDPLTRVHALAHACCESETCICACHTGKLPLVGVKPGDPAPIVRCGDGEQ